MAEIILTKDNFDEVVLNSEKPVLVDFWAPWCGPCRMMGPIVEKLAEKAEDKYIIAKVNIEDEAELAYRFNVMSVPTFKAFKEGKVASTAIGIMSQEKLYKMVAGE